MADKKQPRKIASITGEVQSRLKKSGDGYYACYVFMLEFPDGRKYETMAFPSFGEKAVIEAFDEGAD